VHLSFALAVLLAVLLTLMPRVYQPSSGSSSEKIEPISDFSVNCLIYL
jgi:hypothetical protein